MIGATAYLETSEGLRFAVQLVDYRPAYGNPRWEVEPVEGMPGNAGTAVVDGRRLLLSED